MAHRGRPRKDDIKQLRERIKRNRDWTVSAIREFIQRDRPLTSRDRALVAARVLLTLQLGKPYQRERCQPLINELLAFARTAGPHGKWPSNRDFLDAFIRHHAPDRNNWLYFVEPVRAACDERNVKELAVLLRDSKAAANKHHSPGRPDVGRLLALANRVIPHDPTSWPSLRELKMAVGLSERVIREIIKTLRPRQAEIIEKPRERFTRTGAMPNCYGPRLIYGVLHKFLERLQEFRIADDERERCRKAALKLKRVLITRQRGTRPAL